MKHIFTSLLASAFLIGFVQANPLKTTVATVEQVYKYAMTGFSPAGKSIQTKLAAYYSSVDYHLVHLAKDSAGGKVYLTVTTDMTYETPSVTFRIIKSLDSVATKAFYENPMVLKKQVIAGMVSSEINGIAKRAVENLKHLEELKGKFDWESHEAWLAKNQAGELENTLAIADRITFNPLNIVASLEGGGPAAIYELGFKFSKQTTAEEVGRILQALTEAI